MMMMMMMMMMEMSDVFACCTGIWNQAYPARLFNQLVHGIFSSPGDWYGTCSP
jgi:hypothetical protein